MFRKGLALRPQDVPTRNNLALVMLLSGDTKTALSILEDLDRSGASPEAKATLALARERLGMGSQGAVQPAPRTEVTPLLLSPATPARS